MSAWQRRFRDVKTLAALALPRRKADSHAARLDAFYRAQADHYDDFRRRMLHGRADLVRRLALQEGEVWVDLGAGTGANLEAVADQIPRLDRVYLVDLCGPLLEQAEARVRRHGWTNVEIIEADVAAFQLPEGVQADAATCSYSLTMMPEWFAIVDHVRALLRPGGRLGVVDFYVTPKHVATDAARQSGLARTVWPLWFALDDVFLSPDHLPYLRHRFEEIYADERRGAIPYLPFVRAPYYLFLGRKA